MVAPWNTGAREEPDSPKPAPQQQGGWPPKLRLWVERAFAQCTGDMDRKRVEIALKEAISEANRTGSLWSEDWDHYTLPMDMPTEPRASPKGRRGKKNKGQNQQGKKRKQGFELEESGSEQRAREQRAGRFANTDTARHVMLLRDSCYRTGDRERCGC